MAIECHLPEIRTHRPQLSRACSLKGPTASGMSCRRTCSKQTGVVRKGKLRHSGHAEDEKHYGRVVPQDKAALTVEMLNWA